MSACDAVSALLDLHREGRLTAGREAEVAAHLKGCASCSARSAREAPPRAAAPRPPEGFASVLRARLAAAPAGAFSAEPIRGGDLLRPAAMAAAGAALLLAAGALWPGPVSQRPAAEPGLSIAEAP